MYKNLSRVQLIPFSLQYMKLFAFSYSCVYNHQHQHQHIAFFMNIPVHNIHENMIMDDTIIFFHFENELVFMHPGILLCVMYQIPNRK